jgi:hypothetical protein
VIKPKKAASDDRRKALVLLVEELMAKEPHEAFGLTWAARHQSYYCEKLNTCPATIRKLIAKPPFVRKQAQVGTGKIVINGTKQISGPKKLTLLRIGEAPPKDVADEAKRVMIKFWNKEIGKKVKYHEGQCLWGMTGDVMELLAAVGLPAELGGELAIAVFKHALADWHQVASAIKWAMQARPGYKPRFYDFPCIPVIRSFYLAAVHAYACHLQETKAKPPAGLEILADLTGVKPSDHPMWKIMTITDPMIGHPGLTPEIEKANAGGHAAAKAKLLAKVAAEATPF